LGSSTVVTDAAGNLAEETAFYPFGAARHSERPDDIATDYGFIQKEHDSESGLQYFGHRYLHPALGRWISTDPLLEKGGGRNPYAYVNHSPLQHLDPDGAEITVTKGKDPKTGTPVYKIHMQAVLINVSSTKFSQQELVDYTAKLRTSIKDTFTGAEKGKARWTTSVDLRVIDHPSQIGDCDHVIRIMDKTRDDAAGATVAGTKVIDIAAHTLRRLRPDQVDRSNPMNRHYTSEHYISPEGTGTHEFGHSGGLPHVHGKANLMQPGSERKYDNKDITRQQIEMMYKASSSGKLNQRDKELNDLTRRQ
jgi:RHS repeat-associated protein